MGRVVTMSTMHMGVRCTCPRPVRAQGGQRGSRDGERVKARIENCRRAAQASLGLKGTVAVWVSAPRRCQLHLPGEVYA